MKNLFIVMKFTMRELVRKKSFLISTIIFLALVVLACSLPKLISLSNNNDSKTKVLLVDNSNVFEGNLVAIEQLDIPNYEFKVGNYEFEEIKKKINDKEVYSAIVIDKEENTIKLKYIVENKIWADKIPQEVFGAISSIYSNMQISKLGLTQEELNMISPNFETTIEQTQEDSVDGSNVLLVMALNIILSMGIILFTAQVATSITNEKTSKIMETLVTSTNPRTIVLGKTLGVGLVGLAQIVLIIITAVISVNLFMEPGFLESIINVNNLTVGFVLITLVYFILGFFAFALMYAVTGSMVTKPEDVQSANTPVSILLMIGFYLGHFTISIDPTVGIGTFAGYFPLSSPFCMPARVLMGLANWYEILISIVLLIITVALIAKIAIKVYSNAILNYGSKMSIKDAFKLYKQK